MTVRVRAWLEGHGDMLANTASLIGTTVVTSGLGFVYWWVAAQLFPATAVGFASAAVSAMMLLGVMGMVGLGTLLVSELPRLPRSSAGSLLTAALILAAVVSLGLGIGFSVGAPYIAPSFAPLAQNILSVMLFALGVALTAVTMVLDLALIGLLRGELQFWRNASFSVSKFVLLIALGMWLEGDGLKIYGTWLIGNLLSLLLLVFLLARKGTPSMYRPTWSWLLGLKRVAFKHHGLNLAAQAPGFIFPILVVAALSTEANASFYAAWMIVSFIYVVPSHLSTVLHAVGALNPEELALKLRFSLKLSLLAITLAATALLVVAPSVLRVFGPAYTEAQWCLRVLALGAFPVIVKAHYITISRLRNFVGRAAAYATAGGILELVLAASGVFLGGLTGLGVGIVAALFIESIFMAPTVYRSLRSQNLMLRPPIR